MPSSSGLTPLPRASAQAAPTPTDTESLHVAIIMDGNRRWAKARGLPRTLGHRAGVNALKRTVEGAPSLGVDRLTVFGFSTENWRRTADEVSELMGLLKLYVETDLPRLEREGVRVRVVGRREGLKPDVLAIIDRAEQRTAHNDRFLLQVAFNYGGRDDIARAARRLAEADRDPAGSDRAHERRGPAVELPALGGGVRRAGVPGRALAGLRPGTSGRGGGALP